MIWSLATDIGIAGRGWGGDEQPYARLPGRAEGVIPTAVWDLSRQSAGLWVDFRTDAGTLHARTVLSQPPPPEHHYIKYLDLYGRDGRGRWRWAGVSRFGFIPSGETPLIEGLSAGWRDWRLYLPLTYRIERLEVGVPEGASIIPAPRDVRHPVVVYGTSIVHGCGHVSRPGMVWPSIVGRRLDWPVVNLGFSGSARMEPELAPFLAELDPAVFVVDPLANMSKAQVETNAEAFLRILLRAHPKMPVLMMEDRPHAHAWLLPGYGPARQAKLAAWRDLAAKLRAEGYAIYELSGESLLGDDGEATTDGSHPSDLGAMRYAEAVVPVLAGLLPEPRTLNSFSEQHR